MKKLFIGLLCLGGLNLMHGQTDIEFEEFTLDNGLHVILHEDNSTPIVAVSVLYHVGSKNERKGRTGFAHFFEHLMFEGSPNIERGEFMNIVQANGGALNANTTFDRTFYYEVLPSNQLKLGLWLESERMMHATVDKKGVETQREVVKEEKRKRYDNQPYGTWMPEMFKRAFPNSYYGVTPIGTLEDLNAAKIEDFGTFYNTYYVPNNATLSIAGDIDVKDTKKLVKKYFGEISKGEKEINRPENEPAALTQEKVDTVYDNIQLPGVFMGYRAPKQGTKDAYALEMLGKVLSDGQSSRLYKTVVDEKELGVTINSFPFAMEKGGLFITFGLLNQGASMNDFMNTVNSEIAKVRNEKISEREYKKVQNQVENDFISQLSSVRGIAESLANYHVYFGDANLINTEIKKYREVTREDMKRVANEYLTKDNRVVLYFLPKNNS